LLYLIGSSSGSSGSSEGGFDWHYFDVSIICDIVYSPSSYLTEYCQQSIIKICL
jgi:hypothetical protein